MTATRSAVSTATATASASLSSTGTSTNTFTASASPSGNATSANGGGAAAAGLSSSAVAGVAIGTTLLTIGAAGVLFAFVTQSTSPAARSLAAMFQGPTAQGYQATAGEGTRLL